jgi:hypothetical protein
MTSKNELKFAIFVALFMIILVLTGAVLMPLGVALTATQKLVIAASFFVIFLALFTLLKKFSIDFFFAHKGKATLVLAAILLMTVLCSRGTAYLADNFLLNRTPKNVVVQKDGAPSMSVKSDH